MPKNRKLVYFVTVDWFFCSHFIERAISCHENDFEVTLVTTITDKKEFIENSGITIQELPIKRSGINPFSDIVVLFRLYKIIKQLKPDIIHNVAAKPIIYGTLIGKLARIKHIVNAPVGMGFIFSSKSILANTIRPFLTILYRFFMNPIGTHTILENKDDYNYLIFNKFIHPTRSSLIRGAGVDTARFFPVVTSDNYLRILLPARMLKEKGIYEFYKIAKILKIKYPHCIFILAGKTDPENRGSIPEHILQEWVAEGNIEWLGHIEDMAELMKKCNIVCLPSYREGLPKSLLEACSSGLPVVTTDVPGCREIIQHGINGLLVKPRSIESLLQGTEQLILNKDLRSELGANGRKIVEKYFSNSVIIAETLSLYRNLLKLDSSDD